MTLPFTKVIDDVSVSCAKRLVVLFAADLHGNQTQYSKIFDFALRSSVKAIIFGGDLSPKSHKKRTIEGQRLFYTEKLFPLIKEFHKNSYAIGSSCKVFLILGNDDFKDNLSLIKSYEKEIGYKCFTDDVVSLCDDIDLIGYSHVPFTPFIYKDWEKKDLSNSSDLKYRSDMRLNGLISRDGELHSVDIQDRMSRNAIQKDLRMLFERSYQSKKILVSHAPPFKTGLDLIYHGDHVGSRAVKKAILKYKPYASLHGHIHETVEMSRLFKEHIGSCLAMAVGNSHTTKDPAILIFDAHNPKHVVRHIIDYDMHNDLSTRSIFLAMRSLHAGENASHFARMFSKRSICFWSGKRQRSDSRFWHTIRQISSTPVAAIAFLSIRMFGQLKSLSRWMPR